MRIRRNSTALKYAVIGVLVLMVVGLSGMYQVAIENFPRPEPFPTTTLTRPSTDITTTTTTQEGVTLSGTVTVKAWNVETEQMDSWSWALGDDVDPRFDNAVVNGTLDFIIVIDQGADDVTGVTLEIDGIDNSYYGAFQFTQASTNRYLLSFDTTQLENGEYKFKIYATVVSDSGGPDPDQRDVLFCVFGFTSIQNTDGGSSGNITTVEEGLVIDPIFVMAMLVVVVSGGVVYRKLGTRMKRR